MNVCYTYVADIHPRRMDVRLPSIQIVMSICGASERRQRGGVL